MSKQKYNSYFKPNKDNDLHLKNLNEVDASEIHEIRPELNDKVEESVGNSENTQENTENVIVDNEEVNETNEKVEESGFEAKKEQKDEDELGHIEESHNVSKKDTERWVNGYILDCPGLNMREMPSTTGKVIKILKSGDEVQFTDIPNNLEWCKVNHEGNIGYCMSRYLVKRSVFFN